MRKPRRECADPEPIRGVIPAILRGIKGDGTLQRLRGVWCEVVGEEVSRRTRITAFANGKLSVVVASAALKHDLATFRGEALLRTLNERLPGVGIREVSYRVASLR